MKIDFENYDAIIFDLGGVILNIDYQLTINEFKKLGISNFEVMYSQANQSGLFDLFETGKISTQSFINQLLPFLPKGTRANQVVDAWNKMIIDFPIENLTLLDEVKKRKPIYLLSNTNEIHIQNFNRKLFQQTSQKDLKPYFNDVFYSNEIGMRKPNEETFEFVLKKMDKKASEVLFIDDSIQHIEGAVKVGITSLHLTNELSITNLFKFN
jgi:glucose-1-phosphatase